jgi:hypothetical protein
MLWRPGQQIHPVIKVAKVCNPGLVKQGAKAKRSSCRLNGMLGSNKWIPPSYAFEQDRQCLPLHCAPAVIRAGRVELDPSLCDYYGPEAPLLL